MFIYEEGKNRTHSSLWELVEQWEEIQRTRSDFEDSDSFPTAGAPYQEGLTRFPDGREHV